VINFKKALPVVAAAAVAGSAWAATRDNISIVGSSTVYPFATVVAEQFGKTTEYPTPTVESTGSGGGLKLFCAGVGVEHPDITNASRRIKQSELDRCQSNGVEVVEVKVGYDGIVLANAKGAEQLDLSREEIYLALAKDVPQDGEMVANPNKSWQDVNPDLPAIKIEVLGPPPTSGTRDAFVELVMEAGCESFEAVEALEGDAKDSACQAMREDGAFIEAGENDNLIVQKLEANKGAMGIFGFSFLDQNRNKVQGSSIDGVVPTFDAIADGSYPVSRPLFFYVKKNHVGTIPGIDEYVAEFTSDDAWGDLGYLTDRGLIPMPEKERETYAGNEYRSMHSLPSYYGTFTALWCLLPAVLLLGVWIAFEDAIITSLVVDSLPGSYQELPESELGLVINDIRNQVSGNVVSGKLNSDLQAAVARYRNLEHISTAAMWVVVFGTAAIGGMLAWRRVAPGFWARNRVETVFKILLIVSSSVAILTTVGIVLSVLFEALRFFNKVNLFDFIFGLKWSPQIAIREDQVAAEGAFGAVPLFAGTLLISFIAMLVAAPIGLMSAIYLSEYAPRRVRASAKPLLEILAGVPTVVYGFFAALVVAPLLRDFGTGIGLDVSSESALAAGLVMGIMIIPFVSSLSDDVINAVPQAMRDGSYAMGATQSETVKRVIFPAALPGIVGGLLLAVSRAIGETMIVVMAAGLSANLTANPLESVTTVTVQIVTLLTGDQEFDSAKTLAAFALGLTLFVVTLILNVVALHVVRRYREQYE